jgi:hypothetical protein
MRVELHHPHTPPPPWESRHWKHFSMANITHAFLEIVITVFWYIFTEVRLLVYI